MTMRKYIDPEQFYIARRRAGLTTSQAANQLDVDIKTIRNWENAKTKIPYAAFRLMRLYGGYGLINKGWQGWALWEGKLFSPTGRSFEPHELSYLSNYLSMARLFIKNYSLLNQASRAQALEDALFSSQTRNTERGKASGAAAPAGASPCHAPSVTIQGRSQQGASVVFSSVVGQINIAGFAEAANQTFYERKGA